MGRWNRYQNLDDELKTKFSDQKKKSKFWERGKWENYILPFLPPKKEVKDMIFIDMGCNGGLFSSYAEEYGFGRVIGVECQKDLAERAKAYRDKNGYHYEIIHGKMEDVIYDLPVCDYMAFINSHYYVLIQDWLRVVDYLHTKARHVIITTTKKKEYFCAASAYGRNVKRYFRNNWNYLGKVGQLPGEDDPLPRSLGSLHFESKTLERVKIKDLLKGNHLQGHFHRELEMGIEPFKTKYFKMLCKRGGNPYRPRRELEEQMMGRVNAYLDVKKNGVKEPIIVNKHNRVLDGNHRADYLPSLGFKTTIVRRIC